MSVVAVDVGVLYGVVYVCRRRYSALSFFAEPAARLVGACADVVRLLVRCVPTTTAERCCG